MSKRYTAAYLGAVFSQEVASEKETIISCCDGREPDRWFVDTGEGRADFKALVAEISAGLVHEVLLRGREVLPHSSVLVGEFFDALMETDTELHYLPQGTTNPTEKLMAQILPLLTEWDNGMRVHFAAQGHFTLYAGLEDVRALRSILQRSGTRQAKRWLEDLLPLGEEALDPPGGECLASREIGNKRYAADRVAELIENDCESDTDALSVQLEREAADAERTLREAATAQEESDWDEFIAQYLRRRAAEVGRSTDLNEFNRNARVTVLNEEADLLDRRWKHGE